MERKADKPSRLKERQPNNRFAGMSHSVVGRFLIYLGQAVIVLLVLSGPVSAEGVGTSDSVGNIIRGDVLNIEGETYTIKDITGHEVAIRVNGETKHEDRIKVGDKVQAQVGSDGVAQSIRVQLPDDASATKPH